MRKTASQAATAAEQPDTDALPRPPHGGSFVRQEDGSLKMVEGAVEPAADPTPAEPGTDQQEG